MYRRESLSVSSKIIYIRGRDMNKTLSRGSRLGLGFAALLGFTASSYAAADALVVNKFELVIMQTSLGGQEIFAGEFAAAVDKINSTLSLDTKYAKSTNLCAAYTAQGEFTSAQPHCRTALSLSRSSNHGTFLISRAYVAKKSRQAMALNNFGVWHALQGNADEAQTYFQKASTKSRDLSVTSSRNIDVLELRIGSATVAAS